MSTSFSRSLATSLLGGWPRPVSRGRRLFISASGPDQLAQTGKEPIVLIQIDKWNLLAFDPAGNVAKRLSRSGLFVEGHRVAPVAADEDRLVFGHDSDQVNRQHVEEGVNAPQVGAFPHL